MAANADVEVPHAAARSPAQERRLRKRRQEARIRMRLAADAALLAGHHASPQPVMLPQGFVYVSQAEFAVLREEVATLRALVGALQSGIAACQTSAVTSCLSVEVETAPMAVEQPAVAVEQDVVSDGQVHSWRVTSLHESAASAETRHVFAEASFIAKRLRPLHPNEVVSGHLLLVDSSTGIQWLRLSKEEGFVAVATIDFAFPGVPLIKGQPILALELLNDPG